MRRAVRRGRWLERWVGHAAGGCALLAGHPRVRGAVRWGGTPCLPSGTVASLQHRQSRTDSHSVQEPGAAPSPPKHSPRGVQPRTPQSQPSGARLPLATGAGDSPLVPPGRRQRDPHPSPAAAPISGSAFATPCRVPGAGCTMHRGNRPVLRQAPPPQSRPSSPDSCRPGPAAGGRVDRDPTRARGPTRFPAVLPGGCGAASAGARGMAGGRMGAGPAA